MALESGTRLGPYQIDGLLGTGGMGEVYKARDTRLDRTVAIKVLPSAFADDPTLRQRLEREARAVSALDHPHICALYDIGADNGVDFIVMQYLPGETLAARLGRGPLAIDEVCALGAQIADALAAAHRRNIVHRDLKPGNIMLGRDGVRLMDFGLAKQHGPLAGSPAAQTMTTPLTGARTIVGTLQYMAPEQLEGREVDPRTDIFALGSVLHEMITARRAFDGDSSASLITAIMTGRRAPIASLAPAAPPALTRIIDRCLASDPEDRWQSAGDLGYALRTLRQNADGVAAPAPARRPSLGSRLVWPAVLAVGVMAVAVAWAWPARGVRETPREMRLSVLPPAGLELAGDAADFDPEFAVSPDGSRIALIAVTRQGHRSLWVRDFASVIPREVPGTRTARRPFWSPDGRWIGYMTDAGLARVAPESGSPNAIPSSVSPSPNANAAWTNDGRIIFEASVGSEGPRAKALFVVSERGGSAEKLAGSIAVPNEQAQRYPVVLPDGRHFLYLSWTSEPADRAIYIGSLDGSGTRTLLVKTGFRPGFVAPDTLVYVRDRNLVAQRFSLSEGRLVGDPAPITSGVALEAIPGQATFAVSPGGVVAYRSRSREIASELRWVDRSGRVEDTFESAADITVSLGRDGRRAALTRVNTATADEERFPSNVWLLDLSRRLVSRITLDSASTDENPVWSPDGHRLAYATHRGSGLAEVLVQSATGGGGGRVAATGPQNFHPIDWADDGTLLLHAYATGTGADDLDLYTLGPEPGATPRPFLVAPASQAQGQFSPDGRWVAYASDESGRLEVFVRARSGGGARVQVSSSGGGQPRWRADGRELYYVSLTGTVTAVPLGAVGDELIPGTPMPLFTELTLGTNNNVFFYGGAAGYDVTSDGKRFLVNRLTREPSAGPLHVVVYWDRRGPDE
ncbi:MAG TPA: protein kinase [Vicinamibacterales bacterium]|nr:protein kinase [Vicinamibacterales bacterium]